MNNNLFLKKYRGSCEFVTKEGPLGILNHLHYNIIGYKPKEIKKKKPPKKPEPIYSYISSIVKYDFNKNKNFVSQLSIFLDNLKNKEMSHNNIKSKTQNNNEEKQNNLINNNNTDNKNDIFRKKLKLKTYNLKPNYNNINKKTEKKIFRFKDKRIHNKILNKNESMASINKFRSINFDNNSKKILPLINYSQDLNHNIKIEKDNNRNKKLFTPFINRQNSLYKKNHMSKFHLNKELDELLKKSNSTLNINRKNNNINNENNSIYDNNYFHNSQTIRKKIDDNKNLIFNKILSNNDGFKLKRKKLKDIIKRIDMNIKLNKIDNESLINNNPVKNNNNENLNIIHEENDDNNNTKNINKNINNNKSLNFIDLIMNQRHQYFRNIENSIRYKKAMSIDLKII